jgi:hypothetical protein
MEMFAIARKNWAKFLGVIANCNDVIELKSNDLG